MYPNVNFDKKLRHIKNDSLSLILQKTSDALPFYRYPHPASDSNKPVLTYQAGRFPHSIRPQSSGMPGWSATDAFKSKRTLSLHAIQGKPNSCRVLSLPPQHLIQASTQQHFINPNQTVDPSFNNELTALPAYLPGAYQLQQIEDKMQIAPAILQVSRIIVFQ